MFTGLIEETGTVKSVFNKDGGKIIEIRANFSNELKIKESVSINGACQSVIEKNKDSFCVFTMGESLMRTNLSSLKTGDIVNLERAMRADSRFDGHIVQGHIDGKARFINSTESGGAKILEFEYNTKYIVEKGSIAINGVSLTVCRVTDNSFCVALIPQTLENTNLRFLKKGDEVNIENDIFAKYIEKFLSAKDNKTSKLSEEFLKENGF